MKNKYLFLASLFILPHALADSVQEVNIGKAKCVQTKQNFLNDQPQGPAVTKNYEGAVKLHINGSGVAISTGDGGPNGFVNSLNLRVFSETKSLSGESSSGSTMASSGFGQLVNGPVEDKGIRYLKMAERKLIYDHHVRIPSASGNQGYIISNKCDFPSDIQLSEVHGIYSAAKSAAQVQSDRGEGDEDSGSGTGGSAGSSDASKR